MGSLNIISRSDRQFGGRVEAGTLLARELERYRDGSTVILGIPRGGMIIALAIADIIDAEVDAVLVHKLSSPSNVEFAVGAVSENGQVFIDGLPVMSAARVNGNLRKEVEHQLAEIRRRARQYRSIQPKLALKERPVIITDDGTATGATMLAAIRAVRGEGPKTIIAAVPVAAEEALRGIAAEADETVCLRAPSSFYAVGQFYLSFGQVSDEEIIAAWQSRKRLGRVRP